MLLIDRYAWANKLRTRHPAEKGCLALFCLTACLLADSAGVPLMIMSVMTLLVLGAGIPLRVYGGLLSVPAIFLVCGVLTIAFSVDPPDAYLVKLFVGSHTIGMTEAGFNQAAQTFWRTLGAVSCLYFLVLTTPVTDIFASLERIPFPSLLLEVMILVYGSIAVLMDSAGKIILSQSSRLGYNSPRSTYRSVIWLVTNLFLYSLRRSAEMHLALSSRGYEEKIRFVQPEKKVTPAGMFIAASSGLFFIYLALQTGVKGL